MNLRFGITGKLLVWFLVIIAIFYGTILILYINVEQVVRLSESIVAKNYAIASGTKKIVIAVVGFNFRNHHHRCCCIVVVVVIFIMIVATVSPALHRLQVFTATRTRLLLLAFGRMIDNQQRLRFLRGDEFEEVAG